MEFLIFIGLCWVASKFIDGRKSKSSTNKTSNNNRSSSNYSYRTGATSTSSPRNTSTTNRSGTSSTTPPPRNTTRPAYQGRASSTQHSPSKQAPPVQSYRPTARTSAPTGRPAIKFSTDSTGFGSASSGSTNGTGREVDVVDLAGLHDAFTGQPLNKNLGLHQCQSCKVFYHAESITVLVEVNSGQCVACQSTQIHAVNVSQKQKSGRDYTPDVITLNNYRDHVGSVVTFEAKVVEVKESKRGNDFAVMFETKSWTRGFKLVFFRSAVRKVGGKPYISSLSGKTVRVRGLVVNHPKFGYEIIVSEKSMILSAR
ncbi:hypothetical protein EDB70_101783 [Vibrio crassostreae]|nr:hypothetical protein EDB53_0912 [Vibrio crassostreae]ROR75350.1 hypothetical protein EDB54_0857 [Vibrio crassostreae]TCV32799.1 hypothetical protein EDB70_101783 [Vibrio crassostreae]